MISGVQSGRGGFCSGIASDHYNAAFGPLRPSLSDAGYSQIRITCFGRWKSAFVNGIPFWFIHRNRPRISCSQCYYSRNPNYFTGEYVLEHIYEKFFRNIPLNSIRAESFRCFDSRKMDVPNPGRDRESCNYSSSQKGCQTK